MLQETKTASPYKVVQNYMAMGILFIKFSSDIPVSAGSSDLPYSNQVTSIGRESFTVHRSPADQDTCGFLAHTALLTEMKMRIKIKSYKHHCAKSVIMLQSRSSL